MRQRRRQMGNMVGHDAPHAPEASFGSRSKENNGYESLISCLYDEIDTNPLSRFRDNIIQLPLEQGGWCIAETGERLYYVVVRPEAGRASVQNAQLRHLDPSGSVLKPVRREVISSTSVSQTRASRAVREVVDFAVANDLVRLFTLTYADEPDSPSSCAHEFKNFLRRVRWGREPFPWVEVLERGGDGGRLHHHVLTDASISRRDVTASWGRGHVLHSRARTASGVRRIAGYVCKTFHTPPDDRLGTHRYRVSRFGVRPRAQGLVVTEAELQSILKRVAPGGSYPWYPREPIPFHEYSLLWDPYKPA